jgi:hypothetical protein
MIGISLPMFFCYLAGLMLYTGGSFFALILSDGHPAFLIMLAFGLFFFYLCWMVLVTDWQSPKRGRQQ